MERSLCVELEEINAFVEDAEREIELLSRGWLPASSAAAAEETNQKTRRARHSAHNGTVPMMPCNPPRGLMDRHRPTIQNIASSDAAVAQIAFKKEWGKLWEHKVWHYDPADETTVREWFEVAAEARFEGVEIHLGRLFGIMAEKGSELDDGDPRKKYK